MFLNSTTNKLKYVPDCFSFAFLKNISDLHYFGQSKSLQEYIIFVFYTKFSINDMLVLNHL